MTKFVQQNDTEERAIVQRCPNWIVIAVRKLSELECGDYEPSKMQIHPYPCHTKEWKRAFRYRSALTRLGWLRRRQRLRLAAQWALLGCLWITSGLRNGWRILNSPLPWSGRVPPSVVKGDLPSVLGVAAPVPDC